MMLYRFVDAQKAEGFPVRMVCSVVGVSPSAYYAYRHRPRSGPAQLVEDALARTDRCRGFIVDRVGWDRMVRHERRSRRVDVGEAGW